MKGSIYSNKESKDSKIKLLYDIVKNINRESEDISGIIDNIISYINLKIDFIIIKCSKEFENFECIYRRGNGVDEREWLFKQRESLRKSVTNGIVNTINADEKEYYVYPMSTNLNCYFAITDCVDSNAPEKYRLLFEFTLMAIKASESNQLSMLYPMIDPLTKTYNFNTFQSNLDLEIAKIERIHNSEYIFSVILIDIKHLSKINTKYGFPCGDKILIFVANCIKRQIRKADTCYRLGNDEFAIIANLSDEKSAKNALNRIQNEIHNTVIDLCGEKYQIEINSAILEYKKRLKKSDFMKSVYDMLKEEG